MPEISAWQPAETNNNQPPPNGAPENSTTVAEFNNIVREMMAVLSRWYRDSNAELDTGGSAGAYTLVSNRSLSGYARGLIFAFRANHTSPAAPTIDIDSQGAVALVNSDGDPIGAGGIVSGRAYLVVYDGTQFQVLGANAHGDLAGGSLHADATSSVAGFMSSADKTKLDGIGSGATGNQAPAEIKTAYESNADTNAFTDTLLSKLNSIDANASAPQDGAAILAKLLTVDGPGSGLNAELLAGIGVSGFVRALGTLPNLGNATQLTGTDRLLVLDDSTHKYLEVQDAGARVVQLTGSKTFSTNDSNTVQRYGGASAITVTIADGNHNTGTEIAICCTSAGTVVISSTATIVSINSNRRITSEGMGVLVKLQAGLWMLAGNLEP